MISCRRYILYIFDYSGNCFIDILCVELYVMYAKILVPYDGSKPSNNALNYAVHIVKANISTSISESSLPSLPATDNTITTIHSRPEVMLLYIVEQIHAPPSFYYGMKIREVKTTEEYLKEVYYNMKAKAMEMLNKKKKEYSNSNISIRTNVFIGKRPVDKIIEFASNNKVDLIVMGTRGLSGISRIRALGSVSRGVAERADCPVLLVH
jgi:nucleotide-binding universal stress UspA family protein